MGFFINWLFLWDLQSIIKLERWKKQNMNSVETWFNALAEADVLQSLGNYSFNNQEFIMPNISQEVAVFNAKDIGHPLINKSTRVDNNLIFNGYGKFVIVTGANMAGKSTFLRTVGVNLVLAMKGVPVCAKEMTFSPIEIFSSMRTNDSLKGNKSYFFSELSRLKKIIDKLEKGDNLFIILDEILKGTNSLDKKKGSKAFLKKLINYKCKGLIATHDLALGELENEFPDNIKNICFEVITKDKDIEFDYKLYDGITQNLNASFLMKKMGIV